jgi:hypothetical protein
MKHLLFLACAAFYIQNSNAQEISSSSTLSDISEYAPVEDLNIKSKSLRIINGHSSAVLPKGSFEISIVHRFGQVSTGIDNLWGIDNLNSNRIGFDYGATKKLTVGAGRSSYYKTFNGYLKYSLVGDYSSPFSLAYVADMIVDGRSTTDWNLNPFYFTHRINYTHQLIASYTFHPKLIVGITPTIVHMNMVDGLNMRNDIPVMGGYVRMAVNKHMSFTLEANKITSFGLNLPIKANPTVGLGFEYFTPKHAFQISLSNSRMLNEPYFMVTDQVPNTFSQFCLGFNIVRRW